MTIVGIAFLIIAVIAGVAGACIKDNKNINK